MKDLLVGIDLGGTFIKLALADRQGQVLLQESIPTDSHHGPLDVLERICNAVLALVEQLERSSADVAGVGMGVPGLVDVETGTTRFLPNFPGQWRDVPVAEHLSARLQSPVKLLNDARTATLAEQRFGHGRDQANLTMAFFSLGTGVGGGLVIDGKLRLGPMGSAGELGHQTVINGGPQCGCGNRGCLEAVASGPAIAAEGIRLVRMGLAPKLHELVDGNCDLITTLQMSKAADEDLAVRKAIEDAAGWIGIAAANVVTIMHPDLIVLGGGVSKLGEVLRETVQRSINSRVGMFPTDDIEVKLSALGDQAGVLGAVALAAEA